MYAYIPGCPRFFFFLIEQHAFYLFIFELSICIYIFASKLYFILLRKQFHWSFKLFSLQFCPPSGSKRLHFCLRHFNSVSRFDHQWNAFQFMTSCFNSFFSKICQTCETFGENFLRPFRQKFSKQCCTRHALRVYFESFWRMSLLSRVTTRTGIWSICAFLRNWNVF